MLEAVFRKGFNPYTPIVPDKEFEELLSDVFGMIADEVHEGHASGDFSRNSCGICILDPSPISYGKPGLQKIMATAAIGPEGVDFVSNAIAKACLTHDSGQEWGSLLHPPRGHRIPGGAFRWGYAAEVDGTIVGVSGFKPEQDAAVGRTVAMLFNEGMTEAHEEWVRANPLDRGDGTYHSWFTENGEVPTRYSTDCIMTCFDEGQPVIRVTPLSEI